MQADVRRAVESPRALRAPPLPARRRRRARRRAGGGRAQGRAAADAQPAYRAGAAPGLGARRRGGGALSRLVARWRAWVRRAAGVRLASGFEGGWPGVWALAAANAIRAIRAPRAPALAALSAAAVGAAVLAMRVLT